MQVGDLVKQNGWHGLGLIVDIRQYANAQRYKVWFANTPNQVDWIPPAELEVINASR